MDDKKVCACNTFLQTLYKRTPLEGYIYTGLLKMNSFPYKKPYINVPFVGGLHLYIPGAGLDKRTPLGGGTFI